MSNNPKGPSLYEMQREVLDAKLRSAVALERLANVAEDWQAAYGVDGDEAYPEEGRIVPGVFEAMNLDAVPEPKWLTNFHDARDATGVSDEGEVHMPYSAFVKLTDAAQQTEENEATIDGLTLVQGYQAASKRQQKIGELNDAVEDLSEAIRLTVEYVGNDMLPAVEGWEWFDALAKYRPNLAQRFADHPIHLQDQNAPESEAYPDFDCYICRQGENDEEDEPVTSHPNMEFLERVGAPTSSANTDCEPCLGTGYVYHPDLGAHIFCPYCRVEEGGALTPDPHVEPDLIECRYCLGSGYARGPYHGVADGEACEHCDGNGIVEATS